MRAVPRLERFVRLLPTCWDRGCDLPAVWGHSATYINLTDVVDGAVLLILDR